MKIRIAALKDIILMEQNNLEDANFELDMIKKINKRIKESVTTEKYLNVESWNLKNIHFDGEEY